jgi:hypothetical protein
MKKSFALFVIFCYLSIAGFASKPDLKVQKWNPCDLSFKSSAAPVNPFAVSFSADITGPGNIKLSLPGFYDGNNCWKIRFSATKEGKWNITTRSSISDLNNQQTKIVCVVDKNKNLHGGLQIDPENKHHFIFEDGTHWFPFGYEANWLWAMDGNDNSLPTLNPFLDKLAGYGFNFILINAFAYDTNWCLGKTSPDDYGPSALYPWGGSYQNPDFSRFNLVYWAHYDKVIEAMHHRGIGIHLYLKVYNKLVNWPKNNSAEDDLYYRWIIARYAAYPNIIWDLAKEANYEKSVSYKADRLSFIRSIDPYKRLLTVHTDTKTYDDGSYNGILDFRSHQEQTDHLHATVLKQLAQNQWPVFNVESGYEYGPKGITDKTYNRVNSPEDVARFIWEIQLAGGYNAYYYTYSAWDVIRPKDTPPGYSYLKNFSDFFAKKQYWLMKSADSLVSAGYCLANPGKEYIVFQNQAKPFSLKIEGLSKPLPALWFQPFSGKYMKAGKLQNGTINLTPPTAFETGPIVLYVGNNGEMSNKIKIEK